MDMAEAILNSNVLLSFFVKNLGLCRNSADFLKEQRKKKLVLKNPRSEHTCIGSTPTLAMALHQEPGELTHRPVSALIVREEQAVVAALVPMDEELQ
jgi:hypothetical protein